MTQPWFENKNQGHLVAWAVAVVFLGLIAAPALFSKHSSSREPGIVDIGTPGAAVTTAVPPRAARGHGELPLADWADRLSSAGKHDGDAVSAAKPDVEGRAEVRPGM